MQVLILGKAGVVHQVLLGLGPGGLEADAAHAVQDALQSLDIPLAQLLGMLLGGWQGTALGPALIPAVQDSWVPIPKLWMGHGVAHDLYVLGWREGQREIQSH